MCRQVQVYPLMPSNGCRPAIAIGKGPQSLSFLPFGVFSTRASRRYSDGCEMPRIADNVLDGVAFLYPRREEAEKHAKVGGTCFMIGHQIFLDAEPQDAYVPYLVSNRHVVWNSGCPVIRVNRKDGNAPDIIEAECDQWVCHPEGDDVAVICIIGSIDQSIHKITFVDTSKFVTQSFIEETGLGVGDEVFMMGRFINHQGKRDNQSAVRFGSISMMPEPIRNSAIGKDQLSYAVEMRSRTGFSGSPVGVYRTPFTSITDVKKQSFFGVLGVNWGYILDEDGENTWLNGVVPAWKILEILETPALKKIQNRVSEEYRKMKSGGTTGDGVQVAVAGPLATDANPTHQEDFRRLLGAAARKPAQED